MVIIGRFLRNPTDDYGFGGPGDEKMISTGCILIADLGLETFGIANTKISPMYVNELMAVMILIFSHWYLKNKVSKDIRIYFEVVVGIYGFSFLCLLDYLYSF